MHMITLMPSFNIVDYTLDDIKKLNEYRIELNERQGVTKKKVALIEAWKRKEQFLGILNS